MPSANGKPAGKRSTPTLELAACPVCKTQRFSEVANRAAIRQQMEDLWVFQTRRLAAGAPVDQLFDRAVFSQDPPFHLVACDSCGTVMRNPRECADAIVGVYADEAPPRAALNDLFEQQLDFYRPRAKRLAALSHGPGRVLEIGSYLGAFLCAASERGWQAEGRDVNEHANVFARARGCNVTAGTIEDVPVTRRYDAVTLWNCLDQLPDPARALRAARELITKDGIIALRVPNGAYYRFVLESMPDALRTPLLAYNNLLGFPYRFAFTPEALRTMLEDCGFSVADMRGDTLVLTAGKWTRRWARLEERVAKTLTRAVLPDHRSPWIELYARAI